MLTYLVLFVLVVVAVVIVLAFLKFTFIQESTAKAVVRFGGFKKMLFSKVGWQLSEEEGKEENLVEAKGYKHLFGGLRFVGFRFIDKIHTYDWAWVKVKPDEEGGYVLIPRHEENVDFILVGQVYVYGLNIRGKEVVDKELVPVEISLALPAMIVNPRKALFDTTDWFNTFVSMIYPAVRNYVNCNSYKNIIAESKNDLGKDVMAALGTLGVIKELEDHYGIRLLAVQCKGVKLEGEYQDEMTEQWRAQRDAERDKVKRLGSTTATLMAMIADETGSKPEDIQGEFKDDPNTALKKYEGLITINKDFIEQQIASDAKSLRRYYFQGGKGGMDLIALLGDAFRGSSSGGKPGDDGGGQGNRGKSNRGSEKGSGGEKKADKELDDGSQYM